MQQRTEAVGPCACLDQFLMSKQLKVGVTIKPPKKGDSSSCPQATTLPPEPQLALSLPGQEDNEKKVDKEPAAVSSGESVSNASLGYCWCNSEFLVSQQLPFTAGVLPWHCASPQPLAPGKLGLNFPFSHQFPLQDTGEIVSWMYVPLCTDYLRKSLKTEHVTGHGLVLTLFIQSVMWTAKSSLRALDVADRHLPEGLHLEYKLRGSLPAPFLTLISHHRSTRALCWELRMQVMRHFSCRTPSAGAQALWTNPASHHRGNSPW